MEHCGLTEYLMQHDKFMHCLLLELSLLFAVKVLRNIDKGFDLKKIFDIFFSKLLIIIICVIVKVIDFLTISNEMIYEIIICFYVFESACEVFLVGTEYGLPLPDKLKELIEKYIVK